jgi:hypothetical protein
MAAARTSEVGAPLLAYNRRILKICVLTDLREVLNFYCDFVVCVECKIELWWAREICAKVSVLLR